jgi:hypothetical protein
MHQQRRAAIAPLLNAGKATCARCGEPIARGDDWHVDHTDARDGYLGVSHAGCNLAAGAHKVNGTRRHSLDVEQPYRWSQRWFQDPPRGTVIYNGTSPTAEVCTGDGQWAEVDKSLLADYLAELD